MDFIGLIEPMGFIGAGAGDVAGPQLRQLTSACRLPESLNTGSKQFLSRTRHFARSAASVVRLSFPTLFCADNNGGIESPLGGTAIIGANIIVGSLASGTMHSVTWGGSALVTQGDGLLNNLSDPISVTIAEGDVVWVQTRWESTVGVLYETGTAGTEDLDSTNGEISRFAASGLDLTQISSRVAFTGGSSSANLRYGPILILGDHTDPACMVWGSSIADGANSSAKGTPGAPAASGEIGDKGIISRVIGAYHPYSQVTQGGSQVNHFLTPANVAARMTLVPYFTHILIDGTPNDLGGGSKTPAQCVDILKSFAALFPGKKLFACTVTPRTTGAWTLADGSDQTPSTLGEFEQLDVLNALLRAGVDGYEGVWDINAAVRLGSNEFKWFANATATLMTSDGLHPSTYAEQRIRSQAVIDPTDIA